MNLQKIDIISDILLESKNFSIEEKEEYISHFLRKKINKPIISVGSGTCGTIAGAGDTYKEIEKYLKERHIDGKIQKTGCIGICSIEPIVEVQLPGRNRLFLKNITADKVMNVFDDIFHFNIPKEYVLGQIYDETHTEWPNVVDILEIPFFKLQNRIVLKNCGLINIFDINEYIVHGGYKAFVKVINNYTSEEVCEIIEESGLRGRSGGGYPTGKKWKSALFNSASQKYLICNAEESDPGAFMDRAIIEGDPHRLIEGMAIAAYSIGASKAYIYIRAEYEMAIKIIEWAIKEAKEKGLLGQNILNSGFSLEINIQRCPGAFVCGEETALISSIEGKRGMPETKPPYPVQKGLFNKPTLINNVETLATVPDIIKNGPAWFSSIGTITSKGTKIFALSGKIANTSLIEVNMGTTLRQVVYNIAGGILDEQPFKALILGGPIGHCITEKELDTPIGFDELKKAGVSMGSGGIIVLDKNNCIIDTLRYFMDFMQHQSCGKCIPCREGTKRMYEILTNLTRRPQSNIENAPIERLKSVMQLEPLADVMRITSLCGLGQSAANPILSALSKFRSDFEEHLYERYCSAAICKELRTYYIVPENCTGCALCVRKCPTNAIVGTKKMIYYIIEDLCIGCGDCVSSCKFNAILRK